MTVRRAMKRREAEAEPLSDSVEGRRVVVRRGHIPHFSNSGLSDSASAEGTPRDINAEVIADASRPLRATAAPLPPAAAQGLVGDIPDSPVGTGMEDFSPQNRLAEVRRRASGYEREYRLDLVHRLLMRKIPLDQIAQQLSVSIDTITRDRQELMSRLREAARELNIDQMIGHNTGFYEEVVAMSMRAASTATNPLPMRLAALRTALAGQNDMHRFYQAAGVYDVLRFRRTSDGEGASDMQRILSLAESLMSETHRSNREDVVANNPLGEFSGSDSSGVL